MKWLAPGCWVAALAGGFAFGADPGRVVNYDESKVGALALPALLKTGSGEAVTTAEAWMKVRRPEIMGLFERHVYGKTPPREAWGKVEWKVTGVKRDALGGIATRKLVHVSLPDHPGWAGMDIMLYVPNNAGKRVPCFVGLSFNGNHAVSDEPDIPLSTRWMREDKTGGTVANRATEQSRGKELGRWPLKSILAEGFGVATAYCGDLEPDHPDGWKDGLRAALSPDGAKTAWQDGQWGAIGAWAWGLSRIADYLETDAEVDATRLAVIGHSRLGKTALWAGACDPRFGLVVSNESGEGGAALMRRDFGETTAIITKSFPHWFTGTYTRYAGKPADCPVDQHLLIALMAPRSIYIASAVEDRWADPKGEFLAGLNAEPAFALFGLKGYGTAVQPPVGKPVGDTIGYHIREGKHDLTEFDWREYLKFAKRGFGMGG